MPPRATDSHNNNNNSNSSSNNNNASSSSSSYHRLNQINDDDTTENEEGRIMKKRLWKLWLFVSLLGFDFIISVLLLTPILPFVNKYEGIISYHHHYTLYGSIVDLQFFSIIRILSAVLALLVSYNSNKEEYESSPFELFHQNGDRKSNEELENEALEEKCCPWFKRYSKRPAFCFEVIAIVTGLLTTAKCLSRLNYELVGDEDHNMHPIFWIALAFVTAFCCLETTFLDPSCKLAFQWGQSRRGPQQQQQQQQNTSWIRRIGSNLSIPLLSGASEDDEDQAQQQNTNDEESDNNNSDVEEDDPADVRGVSEISSDSNYNATMSDLLSICYPDLHLIVLAFVFLLLAAVAQVYIPKFTGNILDALESTFADNASNGGGGGGGGGGGNNNNDDESIWDVPGFVTNVQRLVVASVLGGVFSGIRGSVFTVIGGRANVRLRVQLMDSLLSQDVGFYDTTKTGDITSRLSSDTTLVGDQVTLNVNVFLRSLVQAIGVLIFMFITSWQLSLLAFISVPLITVLSKWYGNFVRSLTKLMQKKLADGNSVSEAAIGSMETVRAFDAGESELREFETCMEQYLSLNVRSAIAYCGYATCVTSLPQLVTALVLYYGGLLVKNGDMSSGQLVSFLLYLTSLSDAFGSIGYIFSSLTQAVGAADKVFELIRRKPKITPPSTNIIGDETGRRSQDLPSRGILGIEATKTAAQRLSGISPESCRGEVSLRDVELYYPARPQRRVLHEMNLDIPSGSVIALVGASGGGKSSVMSLLQHLYEPSSGQVFIDGNQVHDLCPQWLSRHLSVVSQEPTLFARSIKRNIMYGLEGTEYEPSDEDIKEAARLANASVFIDKLPFGYETEVGERGVQLSGGQKQRIAIARALVRKPKILLLDEATSALDAESEALVQEAIDSMIARGRETSSLEAHHHPGMTVLIVAHRLSTVRNADIIFVVSEGKVVEKGDHNSLLLNPDGAYSALIARQMQAQEKLENGK